MGDIWKDVPGILERVIPVKDAGKRNSATCDMVWILMRRERTNRLREKLDQNK